MKTVSATKHFSEGGPLQVDEPQRMLAADGLRRMLRLWRVVTVCALATFSMLASVNAQTLDARISVTSVVPARLRIDARLPAVTNALSFRNTYGGVLGLGERIETVEGIRDSGERVPAQKVAPGEFHSTEKFSRFIYEVNLSGPVRPADLSHVSSLSSDQGVLMLADLLPQPFANSSRYTSARIKLDLPAGWTAASSVNNEGGELSTDDPENAVVLIAPSLHSKQRRLVTTNFSMVSSGKWSFSESDATKMAGEILEEYSRVTNFQLRCNATLMLVPYPGEAGPDSWTAETRGNVIVLVLGRKAGSKRVLARLGIVLSHELFHLWVPNSLKLEGDYDWFFEGFTLYEALRMDLRLGLISFNDYLETIARVYDSYLSAADRDRLSLIEASERRWTTSNSFVYEKGMLVAFVYDLLLRKATNCGASLEEVYAELFRRSATGQGSANEIIMSVLGEREELKTFSREYVESAAKIDLHEILSAYGIQAGTSASGTTTFAVIRELTSTQKSLLRCVGYRK